MTHGWTDGRAPPPPKGWQSAQQLTESGFIGGWHTITRKITALRAALVDEARASGLSEEEAIVHVEAHFIVPKKPPRGPTSVYISPSALLLLDLAHADRQTAKWKSADKLSEEYRGTPLTLSRKLKECRTALIASMVADGLDEIIAKSVVERYFIKDKNKRFDNAPVTYASPAAIELLEHEGLFTRKWSEQRRLASDQESKGTPHR